MPALAAGHRVVASRDHLLPLGAHSGLDSTKLIDEPGRLEMDSKSLPAEQVNELIIIEFIIIEIIIYILLSLKLVFYTFIWIYYRETLFTYSIINFL